MSGRLTLGMTALVFSASIGLALSHHDHTPALPAPAAIETVAAMRAGSAGATARGAGPGQDAAAARSAPRSSRRPATSRSAGHTWLLRHFAEEIDDADPAELRALRELDFGRQRVRDDDLVHLRELPALVRLDLAHARVTDFGVRHLAALPRLAELDLSHTEVTAAGLRRLAQTPLRELRCDAVPLTDDDMPVFGLFRGLIRVSLAHTSVTDAGLAAIGAGCQSLRQIRLDHTRVTARGIRMLLRLNPALRRIEARDAGLREADVEALMAVHPDVRFVVRRGRNAARSARAR